MNNRISSWFTMEMKGFRSGSFWLVLFMYLLLLSSIWFRKLDQGQFPNPMLYNETLSLIVCVMISMLFFQREWGGGSMETIASYPVSLTRMTVGKWMLSVMFILLAQAGWIVVYLLKYGQIKASIFPWEGGESVYDKAGMAQLLIQALPAMLLMISITFFGMVLTRRLYGGLALAFACWLLDTITMGAVFRYFTLYTTHLDMREVPFLVNRALLTTSSLLLLLVSCYVINRRARYTKDLELE